MRQRKHWLEILAILVLLGLLGWFVVPRGEEEPVADPGPVYSVNGVSPGMSADQVEAVLGPPGRIRYRDPKHVEVERW